MNKTHTQFLLKGFKAFFPYTKRTDLELSLMYYGFECEDGWFELIKKLLIQIGKVYERIPNHFEGFYVQQVKEKLAGLRFYTSTIPNDTVYTLIRKAEEDSYEICEYCGVKGVVRRDKSWWLQTLCDKHYEQRKRTLGTWKLSKRNLDRLKKGRFTPEAMMEDLLA